MEEYERLRNTLKKRYEERRTGEQTLYIDQSERLKPLIDKQKETARETTEAIQQIGYDTSNALVPFVNELKKRNEQVENLQSLPFYATPGIEAIPQSTPKKDTSGFIIDLDKMLSESDIENLQDMSLPLSSEVIKQGDYDVVLERIKMLNRQCGQHTGKKSQKDEREKQMYKSRRETLEMYRISLEEQMKALKYRTGEGLQKRKRKVYKQKRGRGRPKIYPDTKYYNSPDDLWRELSKHVAAKEAGNTGLDNIVVSILDELLKIKEINKNTYDEWYHSIFSSY